MIHEQNKNINNEVETVEKKQFFFSCKKIAEVLITDLKNSLDGLNSRFDQEESVNSKKSHLKLVNWRGKKIIKKSKNLKDL